MNTGTVTFVPIAYPSPVPLDPLQRTPRDSLSTKDGFVELRGCSWMGGPMYSQPIDGKVAGLRLPECLLE